MDIAYLLSGSNLGNRKDNLDRARAMINQRAGNIELLSSVYETEPWGFAEETDSFYNQAMRISTFLTACELLDELQAIEREQGRVRHEGAYKPRKIDIDILFYDDIILNTPRLVIPHPKIHHRRFTLEILFEIAPALVHPVFKKDIKTLLEECEDDKKVMHLD